MILQMYRQYNCGLCLKLERDLRSIRYKPDLFKTTINEMFDLEMLNLRKTFEISSHNSETAIHKESDLILCKMSSKLSDEKLNILKITEEFRANYLTHQNAPIDRNKIVSAFWENCNALNDKFNEPRRSLEKLYATHMIYRPIKLTDYVTEDQYILKDFANEYRIEVKRQFADILLHTDRKNLIELFSPGVTKFLDKELIKGRGKGSLGTLDNVNEFASQRFRFYRHVVALPTQHPHEGNHPAELRHEIAFDVAFNVLKTMKDRNLPFKLFGSDKVSSLIQIIEANKKQMLDGTERNHVDESLTHKYQTLCEQVIIIVSPKITKFNFHLISNQNVSFLVLDWHH
jgi:hypothetical protein